MRISYNGIITAFQAEDAGSIPAIRSNIKVRRWQKWLLRLPPKQENIGSSPIWRATLKLYCGESVGSP